jgi:tetratricopeptide (TPR) repeat protein
MIKKMVFVAAMLSAASLLLVAQQQQGQKQPQKQPQPTEEQKAISAVQAAAAKGPEALAPAVDDFVLKFPTSPYRARLLNALGDIYESSGNAEKAQNSYQRALDADANDYYSRIMLASEIARSTQPFETDMAARDAKLAKAEKYANEAIPLIASAAKPAPQMTDEQWDALKKDDTARAHQALAMVAMVRKNYDVAVTEFKTSISTAATPDPATSIRLAAAYDAAGKMDDAEQVLDQVLAMPGLPDAYKNVAQSEKKRSEQLKAAKNKK